MEMPDESGILLGCPGKEVDGSKGIGSVGKITPYILHL